MSLKFKLNVCIFLAVMFLTACNDEVFVPRPSDVPPPEEPKPDPEPEKKDSLMLKSLNYQMGSLMIDNSLENVTETATIYKNAGDRSINVYVLYDNYNKSIVKISNHTYYSISWKKEQPEIEVPGIDSAGDPGFFGTKIPFTFGTTIIPDQYMPGGMVTIELPPYSMIRARVYTKRKVVTAKADITYYIYGFAKPSIDSNWVEVSVSVPVEINVELDEILPIE